MADRYTKKDAEQCAGYLAKKLNKKFGKCYHQDSDGKWKYDLGCWDVNDNSDYGGAVIEEINNDRGSVTDPFGSTRMKPEQFCKATNFAEKAIDIDRKSRGGENAE